MVLSCWILNEKCKTLFFLNSWGLGSIEKIRSTSKIYQQNCINHADSLTLLWFSQSQVTMRIFICFCCRNVSTSPFFSSSRTYFPVFVCKLPFINFTFMSTAALFVKIPPYMCSKNSHFPWYILSLKKPFLHIWTSVIFKSCIKGGWKHRDPSLWKQYSSTGHWFLGF